VLSDVKEGKGTRQRKRKRKRFSIRGTSIRKENHRERRPGLRDIATPVRNLKEKE